MTVEEEEEERGRQKRGEDRGGNKRAGKKREMKRRGGEKRKKEGNVANCRGEEKKEGNRGKGRQWDGRKEGTIRFILWDEKSPKTAILTKV